MADYFSKWIKREGGFAVLTIFGREEEREVRVPFTIEICPTCNGSGLTSRHVECDGGGFTAEEWGDQDEDFRRDYMSGAYDRPCDDCRDLPGRRIVPNIKSLSKADRADWIEQCRDEREYQRLSAMERRMGA